MRAGRVYLELISFPFGMRGISSGGPIIYGKGKLRSHAEYAGGSVPCRQFPLPLATWHGEGAHWCWRDFYAMPTFRPNESAKPRAFLGVILFGAGFRVIERWLEWSTTVTHCKNGYR